jgi:hypothetical protein
MSSPSTSTQPPARTPATDIVPLDPTSSGFWWFDPAADLAYRRVGRAAADADCHRTASRISSRYRAGE